MAILDLWHDAWMNCLGQAALILLRVRNQHRRPLLFTVRPGPNRFRVKRFTKPVICLNLKASKGSGIGGQARHLRLGEISVVSHDLPVAARVIEASAERPYLAMIVAVDITL